MRLIFEHVTKKFAQTKAIDDVTFDVEASCVAVVGGNAAGKSTLLKLIATVLKPDEGRVILNGIDIVKHAHLIRKELSYLPEEPALMDTLTARDNLALFSKIKKADYSEELLRSLRFEPNGKKLVKNLSKGSRRKLSLCIALLGEPKILVLDEPTSGLDEEAKQAFWSHLSTLKEKNVAMIIATHDMEEMKKLADFVIVLDRGRLVKIESLNSAASYIQL
ncbi:ABC transporter ATP-binding protein [Pseudothermotoga hypogea DSM 11164 = NBRC 106472]|uniref:ABC transporter ATP-binding protein n=1 Tax=Pseudothermotoga hypogea DSM 11164 = NBRC 106472 TaxID=1123384 RepID=A0A0X1KNP0_9THEM|nr:MULTISPECIES: ABC transporter ATP-binding protein [Pseudothermotoga]AJC72897.1 ABC transporter ATP-binding protein [Pseudothermotoga hypogea DSM 11164 = NBRC 106472]MBC7121933.1 ABC transporter ATP-binding protein [Pseudothermotoga sp.]MDI6862491.1 ABC transporter ATP-binding protein [Pseudothermotoga sp.]